MSNLPQTLTIQFDADKDNVLVDASPRFTSDQISAALAALGLPSTQQWRDHTLDGDSFSLFQEDTMSTQTSRPDDEQWCDEHQQLSEQADEQAADQ